MARVAAPLSPEVVDPSALEVAGPTDLEVKQEEEAVPSALEVAGPSDLVAMCTCHQCQRQVPIADCTLTNKNRVSKKAAAIYRCKWCSRVSVVIYKDMAVDLQLKSLHQGMSRADKIELDEVQASYKRVKDVHARLVAIIEENKPA